LLILLLFLRDIWQGYGQAEPWGDSLSVPFPSWPDPEGDLHRI